MIINNLYVGRFFTFPDKANTPLVIYPNTVLTLSVSAQRL